MTYNGITLLVKVYPSPAIKMINTKIMLITCLPHPRIIKGLELILSSNLPQATIEPDKVIAPIKMAIKISTLFISDGSS